MAAVGTRRRRGAGVLTIIDVPVLVFAGNADEGRDREALQGVIVLGAQLSLANERIAFMHKAGVVGTNRGGRVIDHRSVRLGEGRGDRIPQPGDAGAVEQVPVRVGQGRQAIEGQGRASAVESGSRRAEPV